LNLHYYRLLLAVSAESAWEEWILYVLHGVTQTAIDTEQRIAEIRNLQAQFTQNARAISNVR